MENNKLEKCFKNVLKIVELLFTNLKQVSSYCRELLEVNRKQICQFLLIVKAMDVSTTLDVMLLIGCKIHYQMIQHVKH